MPKGSICAALAALSTRGQWGSQGPCELSHHQRAPRTGLVAPSRRLCPCADPFGDPPSQVTSPCNSPPYARGRMWPYGGSTSWLPILGQVSFQARGRAQQMHHASTSPPREAKFFFVHLIWNLQPCHQRSGSCYSPPPHGTQAFWSFSEPQGEALQVTDVAVVTGGGGRGEEEHTGWETILQRTSKKCGHRDRSWNPGPVPGSLDE